MISKKELVSENEELICLLQDVLECCEEQGIELPQDLQDRIGEFLIITEEGFEDEDGGDIVDITPAS
jgi:hypothetical protein